MQLIILAGGKAARLKLLVGTTPKPLVKVLGQPFLFHMLPTFKKLGFTKFVFLIRNDKDQNMQFHQFLRESLGLSFKLVEDRVRDGGTGRGLVDCIPHLEEKFWLVNGDSWFQYEKSLALKTRLIQEKSDESVMFVTKPKSGDVANVHYVDSSTEIVDYRKKGFESNLESICNGSRFAIDFGFMFLFKKEIEKFAMLNDKKCIDMGDIYLWLIRHKKLRFENTNSTYVDIGTYKGWSFLSTNLSGH
jgi:NDP-sugar pyrophosphorylase family protein